jgi:hypothetical protein
VPGYVWVLTGGLNRVKAQRCLRDRSVGFQVHVHGLEPGREKAAKASSLITGLRRELEAGKWELTSKDGTRTFLSKGRCSSSWTPAPPVIGLFWVHGQSADLSSHPTFQQLRVVSPKVGFNHPVEIARRGEGCSDAGSEHICLSGRCSSWTRNTAKSRVRLRLGHVLA